MMQSAWYPPSKYFFMPLYRRYRRGLGNPRLALAALLATSGLLHIGVVALLAMLVPATAPRAWVVIVFFAMVFGALTLIALGAGSSRGSAKEKSHENSHHH